MRKQLPFIALAMLISNLAFAQAENPDYRSESTEVPLQVLTETVNNSQQKQDEEPSPSSRMNGEIPLNGLVGYYKLDNGTYVDSSPSGFDLVPVGNGGGVFPVENRFGEPNKALNFINEYLDLASDPTAFDFTGGNMSLSAWIKIEIDVIDWVSFVNNWGGFGTGGYYLGVTPTQQIRWNVNGDFPADTDPIPSGVWTHVAVTYDGVDANVWLDGVLVKSEANNTPITASVFPFTVGAQADFPVNQFPGVIDDILVYDRVLTGSEIVDIFTVLSIEDIDAFSSQVQVYPNPSSSTISIIYDSSLGTVKSYRVTDNQGRLIINDSFDGSKTTIDLSAIASGIYLLQLQTIDGVSVTKKIIKN